MNHNLPLASVSRTQVTHSARLALFLVVVLAAQVSSQTILIDDFNDGNDDGWTHFDLIADEVYGPAIFEASSFEYRLAQTDANRNSQESGLFYTEWSASADDPFYSNGLVRLKFRLNEIGSQAGIQTRMNGRESRYGFGAFYVDEFDGNGFGFGRTEFGFTQGVAIHRGGLDLGEDWMLEAGAVGDRLSMKFWPAGESEPAEPQWTWIDPNPLDSGAIALQVRNDHGAVNPRPVDVAFDDIFFTPVPNHRPGDLNGDGLLNAGDIDALTNCVQVSCINPGFDLTADDVVDGADRIFLIKDILNTFYGDSNLDGEFNSGDMVEVFQAGEYEDDIALNSGWATGDWNGDGDFDSSDLVRAFQDGGYENGPRAPLHAVPEPSPVLLLMVGLFVVSITLRR